jgi:starvation-inducible outer membrane lipoprotein
MELTDADLEFATCLAAPPDIEEQPSFSLTRMASLLERNTLVTPHRDAAGGPAAARCAQQAQMLWEVFAL